METTIPTAALESLEARRLMSSAGPVDLGAPHSPDDYYGNNVHRQHTGADEDGNLLYVRESADGTEMYGQWFTAASGWAGQGEFLIGTRPATALLGTGFDMPQVDVAPDGRAVVAWTQKASNTYAVYARTLEGPDDRTGQLVTVATGKGKQSTAEGAVPAIADNGNFVVVWDYEASNWPSTKDTIYAQRFDAAGRKLGSAITVSPESEMYNYPPSVDMDAAGNFVVALPTGSWDIWARRYSSAGTALGSRFLVNSSHSAAGSFGAHGVSVSMAPSGGAFAIGWSGKATATPWATYASPFTVSGSTLVAHPAVQIGAANWTEAAVAYSRDGGSFAAASSSFTYLQHDESNSTEYYRIEAESFTPEGASLGNRETVVYGERYFYHPNGDGSYTETFSGEPFELRRSIGLTALGNTGRFAVSYMFNPVFETRGEERQHAALWTPEAAAPGTYGLFSTDRIDSFVSGESSDEDADDTLTATLL